MREYGSSMNCIAMYKYNTGQQKLIFSHFSLSVIQSLHFHSICKYKNLQSDRIWAPHLTNSFTGSLNPSSANPTKWPNTLKQFAGKLPTNCLSVFDHFVKSALKGRNYLLKEKTGSKYFRYFSCFEVRNESFFKAFVFLWGVAK